MAMPYAFDAYARAFTGERKRLDCDEGVKEISLFPSAALGVALMESKLST